MGASIGWGSALLVWGTAQGVFISTLLAFHARGNRHANRYLAFLTFLISIELADQLFFRLGFACFDPDGRPFFPTIPLAYLNGPAFLAYACALLGRPIPRRVWWIHAVPAAIALADYIPGYWQLARAGWPSGATALHGPAYLFLGWVNAYAFIATMAAQGVAYVVAAMHVFRRYETTLRAHGARSTLVHAPWLRALAVVLLIIMLGHLGMAVLGTVFSHHVAGLELVLAFAFSLVVHVIGFLTVHDPEVFASPHLAAGGGQSGGGSREARTQEAPRQAASMETGSRETVSPGVPPPASTATTLRAHGHGASTPCEPAPSAATKYARSGLAPEAVDVLSRRVASTMKEQRLHLREDLHLADLARAVGLTPNQLSQVLNQGLGSSFFDFVNAFRVEEVQRRLRDPRYQNLTHLAIALEAGFTSKSSFHRVFKRRTGMTPAQWASAPRDETLVR